METSPSEILSESFSEILVVQTAFVGDLLLSIPLLKELRKTHANARLVLLCRKGLGEFMTASGLVDEVIEVEKGKRSSENSWAAARAKLRTRAFALIISPHQSFRSALFIFRLRARRKIGYARAFNRLVFSDRVVRPMHLPEALRQLALLVPLEPATSKWQTRLNNYSKLQDADGGQKAGGLVAVPEWADMTVPRLLALKNDARTKGTFEKASSERVRQIIQRTGGGRIAVLAPGSVWPTKMWTIDGYAKVARELLANGWRIIALGAKAEFEICQRLAELAPGAVSIAGETSLYESTEIIALADLVICNDSGAMHMAAAAATPAVSIFGPTVLELGYRPWQTSVRVVQVDLSCRPCGKHGARNCPLGTHACMKQVTAEMVTASARSLDSDRRGVFVADRNSIKE